ncbi:MAG: sulfite exporter TauE/SafE family protein [Lysobacteraceae bacterium]
MPIDLTVVFAALLSGLLGGLHCALMCGGIAAGVSAATRPAPPLRSAVLANLGRVGGYTLAGVLVGGFGAGLLGLWQAPALALGMRMLVGVVLLLVALRLLGQRDRLAFLSRPGHLIWQRLARLRARLLPADTWGRQLALGMLWGWLPCGLSYSLLSVAWLTADALNGGIVMLAFGLGTSVTMLPLTWSGARLGNVLSRPGLRYTAAGLIAVAGLITLAAPWLARLPVLHGMLELLGCRTLPAG